MDGPAILLWTLNTQFIYKVWYDVQLYLLFSNNKTSVIFSRQLIHLKR